MGDLHPPYILYFLELELIDSAKRNVASIYINSECRRVISVIRRIASVSEEANL